LIQPQQANSYPACCCQRLNGSIDNMKVAAPVLAARMKEGDEATRLRIY
jgi:hypothetical protein